MKFLNIKNNLFKTFGLSIVLPIVVISGLVATAQAHHSFRAQYDANQPIELHGYVTKIEWYNPHVYIYLDVENAETGEYESWGVEMGPPHMLQNRGWKRNSMQIGDEVIVDASRARDGSNTANARRVEMAESGQIMGAASSQQQTLTGGNLGNGN